MIVTQKKYMSGDQEKMVNTPKKKKIVNINFDEIVLLNIFSVYEANIITNTDDSFRFIFFQFVVSSIEDYNDDNDDDDRFLFNRQ